MNNSGKKNNIRIRMGNSMLSYGYTEIEKDTMITATAIVYVNAGSAVFAETYQSIGGRLSGIYTERTIHFTGHLLTTKK